jgi:hypothetical protein
VLEALIGFGGALLGAAAALLGSRLSDRRRARIEDRQWRRDEVARAYAETIRCLIHAAARRSEVDPKLGLGVLKREHQREWFDDFAEARAWLEILISSADPNQRDHLRGVAHELDTSFGIVHQPGSQHHIHISSHARPSADLQHTSRLLLDAVRAVQESSRRDATCAFALPMLREPFTMTWPSSSDTEIANNVSPEVSDGSTE